MDEAQQHTERDDPVPPLPSERTKAGGQGQGFLWAAPIGTDPAAWPDGWVELGSTGEGHRFPPPPDLSEYGARALSGGTLYSGGVVDQS